ncbi:MAG: putative quinol monooxygenase [Mycobacteriales bacterium]
MIAITVRFVVRPEHRDSWLPAVDSFTRATRSEPGNLWFDWARSVDNPDEFVLLEAFRDGPAGEQHVSSEHFKRAMQTMPPYLAETPRILNVETPGDDWGRMGELEVRADATG